MCSLDLWERQRKLGRMLDPIEALKEYIRFPSVSTDPAYADGMKGAREYATSLLQ